MTIKIGIKILLIYGTFSIKQLFIFYFFKASNKKSRNNLKKQQKNRNETEMKCYSSPITKFWLNFQ